MCCEPCALFPPFQPNHLLLFLTCVAPLVRKITHSNRDTALSAAETICAVYIRSVGDILTTLMEVQAAATEMHSWMRKQKMMLVGARTRIMGEMTRHCRGLFLTRTPLKARPRPLISCTHEACRSVNMQT